MDRLAPKTSTLWLVRWERRDGRDVKHRYFVRRADAEAFHAKLVVGGWSAALFTSPTAWAEVS